MAINRDYDDWSVQAGYNYTPGDLDCNEWFSISQKINGVRATYFGSNLVSRSGKNFQGLNLLEQALDILNDRLKANLGTKFAFDGELRLKKAYIDNTMDDNTAFKISCGIANSTKNFSDKHKLEFIIFDMIPLKEFVNDMCSTTYKHRLTWLEYIENLIPANELKGLKVVPRFYAGTDQNMIKTCLYAATEQGMEGIMINRDWYYQYKRTKGLLKCKLFNTIDLKVIGFTEGTGKYEGTLGAIECKYKDNSVFVGTGFDDAQRDYIWAHQDEILGQICEVKYKDLTSDKSTNLESLQFPVFVALRYDKTEADA
jgi:DNA ligase-1